MTRQREPVAVHIAEAGVLVKHTHDVKIAERLARDLLVKDPWCSANRPDEVELPKPACAWVRVIHCLPNSYGAACGWDWRVETAQQGKPGAFRAVEFYT